MKAYIMDEERRMVLADRPEPKESADNLIVKVRSASICGTDMRTFLHGNMKIQVPRIMGHEFAGEIVYAGALAKENGYLEGQRVTCAPAIGCGKCAACRKGHTNMCDHLQTIGFQYDGAFAEYLEIPAQAIRMGNVLHIPDDISNDSGTLIEPAGCANNGQSYLHISKGDNVVIYGSGMIGCIHAQLALIRGASQVMICEPSQKRGRIAQEKVPGAVWIDNGTKDAVKEVKDRTDGEGADVVICATSYPPVQKEAQVLAAKMGRICLFGGLAGESTGLIDSNMIHYKELQISGAHATTPGHMKEIMTLIENGSLDPAKYIEKIVTLDEIESGFIAVRDEDIMKVVVHND